MSAKPPADLTQIRKQLFMLGYKILPNRGKAPVITGWSDPKYLARELTDSGKGTVLEKIERWPKRFPDAHSTGVSLWEKLRAIDIDISDADMVKALLGAIRKFAPDIANRAPKRFGAVPKVALFVRAPDNDEPMKLFNKAGDLIHVGETTFNRMHSSSYRRPGEVEDAPTHAVEIFGGEPTKAGKCSRQFGVYGPHSYNDDGTVAREYGWAADRPALHEIDLADLPTLSYSVACKIVDAFKALAEAAGWTRVEPLKENGDSDLIYDIDETTRFDLNDGTQVSYEQLCEMFVPGWDDLRCSSSFIKGDAGTNRTKCQVFWSPRHDCVAVFNYETAAKHYPARMATVEDWSHTELGEGLRQLREAEQEAKPAAFSLPKAAEKTLASGVTLKDFYAYMPKHQYIFVPTGEMWPAASINARLPKIPIVKKDGTQALDSERKPRSMSPSVWLCRCRAVEQMTWAPGEPPAIIGKLASEGGWVERPGVVTFNLYRPPVMRPGNAGGAGRWIELVKRVYPTNAEHIIAFCAHRVQFPAVKINHGLVLTGPPGIGKDTILEPLKLGVGPWNFKEVSPAEITNTYNDYMRGVVLRISEARDLGEINRYAFYESTKTLMAAPPDVTRVNAKYVGQYYLVNVIAVILTTNYPHDGLYLPPNDRRHYVAGTEVTKEDFDADFWTGLWDWYRSGGLEDVVAYLAEYDLSKFDPKAPPEKTEAFWRMADGGAAPEISELADVLDTLGTKDSDGKPCPPPAVTLAMVTNAALRCGLHEWLTDRRNRRAIPHRFESCGYVPVRNSSAESGLWVIAGKRQVVYGRKDVAPAERLAAAEALKAAEDLKAAELKKSFEAGIGELRK